MVMCQETVRIRTDKQSDNSERYITQHISGEGAVGLLEPSTELSVFGTL